MIPHDAMKILQPQLRSNSQIKKNISLKCSFFKKIFLMWIIFKVFIEFVTIVLLFFMFFFFLAKRHVGS